MAGRSASAAIFWQCIRFRNQRQAPVATVVGAGAAPAPQPASDRVVVSAASWFRAARRWRSDSHSSRATTIPANATAFSVAMPATQGHTDRFARRNRVAAIPPAQGREQRQVAARENFTSTRAIDRHAGTTVFLRAVYSRGKSMELAPIVGGVGNVRRRRCRMQRSHARSASRDASEGLRHKTVFAWDRVIRRKPLRCNCAMRRHRPHHRQNAAEICA